MISQPNLILFATNQPLLVADVCEVLRFAGFDAEHVMLGPRDAFSTLRREDAWLVFFDARNTPDPETLAQAIRRSPQSRFVLCGGAVTPQMLQTAVNSCMHGVLSTDLPIEDAAEALVRVWQGERQFRFGGAQARPYPPPPPAGGDFDAEWMFGHSV